MPPKLAKHAHKQKKALLI